MRSAEVTVTARPAASVAVAGRAGASAQAAVAWAGGAAAGTGPAAGVAGPGAGPAAPPPPQATAGRPASATSAAPRLRASRRDARHGSPEVDLTASFLSAGGAAP